MQQILIRHLDRPRGNHGRDTLRRLRRLQNMPESTGFSLRMSRVLLAPFNLKTEITPQQRKRPWDNYSGSTFLVQKETWNILEAGTF
jgi:hypothetical protein